jgi:hypothetical protein
VTFLVRAFGHVAADISPDVPGGESLNYVFFSDGPATFHRPAQIGHFYPELKMAIGARSAPLCAGLAGNHGVSFTAISILKVANAWSVAAMDARGVRARMARSSAMQGGGLPFRPTRSHCSGDQEPRSHDATAFLAPGLSAPVRYFRLCGAQRPRNVNFSNLGKRLVAEAAGVQRRQRHGNTMIMCAG